MTVYCIKCWLSGKKIWDPNQTTCNFFIFSNHWNSYFLLVVYCHILCIHRVYCYINVREYRKGNQKWTVQRNWQHRVHKTMKKQNKNTAHNVLDTTMRKQTQIIWSLLQTTGGKDEPNIILRGNRNGHHNTELRT
jgi:hypothetical protein